MSTTLRRRCCGCLPCGECCHDDLACDQQDRSYSTLPGFEPVLTGYSSRAFAHYKIGGGGSSEEKVESTQVQIGAATFVQRGSPSFGCYFAVPIQATVRKTSYSSGERSCEATAQRNGWTERSAPERHCTNFSELACRHLSYGQLAIPDSEGNWPFRNCGGGLFTSFIMPDWDWFCLLDFQEGGWDFGGVYDGAGNFLESWEVEHFEDRGDGFQDRRIISITAALANRTQLCERSGGGFECPA